MEMRFSGRRGEPSRPCGFSLCLSRGRDPRWDRYAARACLTQVMHRRFSSALSLTGATSDVPLPVFLFRQAFARAWPEVLATPAALVGFALRSIAPVGGARDAPRILPSPHAVSRWLPPRPDFSPREGLGLWSRVRKLGSRSCGEPKSPRPIGCLNRSRKLGTGFWVLASPASRAKRRLSDATRYAALGFLPLAGFRTRPRLFAERLASTRSRTARGPPVW